MKILQIVTKNTSTLDFTLPIFWGLKKYEVKSEVNVLYCLGDKKRILRQSRFFSNELRDCGASEFDYIDVLQLKNRCLTKLVRRLCQQSFSDHNSFVGLKSNWHKFFIFYQTIIPFVQKKLIYFLECWLARKLNFEDFLKQSSPDLIILDNRNDPQFPGAKNLFNVIFASDIPKIIIPHAPHFIDPYYVFSPVNPYGKDFYPECEAWIPFKYSDVKKNHSSIMHNFHYVGYPGFDEEWVNHCKKKLIPKNKDIVCLYIGRKFLDQHIKKPKNLDYATMDYDSVLSDLLLIKSSFQKLGEKITLIFKPHPSSNYKLVAKVINAASFDNYEITHEPLFGQTDKVDIVISSYSTSVLVPAIAGTPTIVFNSEVQKAANSRWSRVADLYTGLSYFIEPNELTETIEGILYGPGKKEKDITHLRGFFPDGAIKRSIDRLISLKHKS